MKTLTLLLMLSLTLSLAHAQPGEENMMGLFFSDTEFSDATNNYDTAAVPFNCYIVVLNPMVESIAGYEVGIAISDPAVFVLAVSGENGWTNFGDALNHLAGFGTPVPVIDNAAVVCTMQWLYSGLAEITIEFGHATPPSIPGWEGMVIANGADPDDLIPCGTPYGEVNGIVATLNCVCGPGVEKASLSGVKALFR